MFKTYIDIQKEHKMYGTDHIPLLWASEEGHLLQKNQQILKIRERAFSRKESIASAISSSNTIGQRFQGPSIAPSFRQHIHLQLANYPARLLHPPHQELTNSKRWQIAHQKVKLVMSYLTNLFVNTMIQYHLPHQPTLF